MPKILYHHSVLDKKMGLSDDYPIWANKVHKHRPVFCKGDDTLVLFRKWVRQFYLD